MLHRRTRTNRIQPGCHSLGGVEEPRHPPSTSPHLFALAPQSLDCLALIRSPTEQAGTFHGNSTQKEVVTPRNMIMCTHFFVCDLFHLCYCKSLQRDPLLRKPTTLPSFSCVMYLPDFLIDFHYNKASNKVEYFERSS